MPSNSTGTASSARTPTMSRSASTGRGFRNQNRSVASSILARTRKTVPFSVEVFIGNNKLFDMRRRKKRPKGRALLSPLGRRSLLDQHYGLR